MRGIEASSTAFIPFVKSQFHEPRRDHTSADFYLSISVITYSLTFYLDRVYFLLRGQIDTSTGANPALQGGVVKRLLSINPGILRPSVRRVEGLILEGHRLRNSKQMGKDFRKHYVLGFLLWTPSAVE